MSSMTKNTKQDTQDSRTALAFVKEAER